VTRPSYTFCADRFVLWGEEGNDQGEVAEIVSRCSSHRIRTWRGPRWHNGSSGSTFSVDTFIPSKRAEISEFEVTTIGRPGLGGCQTGASSSQRWRARSLVN